MSVYVHIAIIRKRLHIEENLHTILQILSLTMFEKMPLKQLLKGLCILFSGYYFSTKCRGNQSLTYKMLIGSEQNA